MRWRFGWMAACAMLAAACSSAETAETTPDTTTLASRTPTTAPNPSTGEPDAPLATSTPADPVLDSGDAPPMIPEGFERVAAIATTADGEVCELCLWLAETPEQRALGLMFVTDLGDADGMAFRYQRPHSGSFWMKDTRLPLSIAFFAADGTYIDEFDMEPCVTETCLQYRTPRNFLVAVETTQGDLPEIGIGAGSTLVVTDLPCP